VSIAGRDDLNHQDAPVGLHVQGDAEEREAPSVLASPRLELLSDIGKRQFFGVIDGADRDPSVTGSRRSAVSTDAA
jgi:hypothetical protein